MTNFSHSWTSDTWKNSFFRVCCFSRFRWGWELKNNGEKLYILQECGGFWENRADEYVEIKNKFWIWNLHNQSDVEWGEIWKFQRKIFLEKGRGSILIHSTQNYEPEMLIMCFCTFQAKFCSFLNVSYAVRAPPSSLSRSKIILHSVLAIFYSCLREIMFKA